MPAISKKADILRSRTAWLLLAPCIAVLTLGLSAVKPDFSGVTRPAWDALRSSVGSYVVALAVFLFVERFYWTKTPDCNRFLEVFIGIVGLIASAFFVVEFFVGGLISDLRFGGFGAVASIAAMIPRRTDRTRAIAFGIMAVAETHRPFVAIHPPYVSMGILSVAAALICLVHLRVGRTTFRRTFSIGTALGIFMTLLSVGAFNIAYEKGWTGGLLISIIAILYFAGGTILIIARGDWFERHPRQ